MKLDWDRPGVIRATLTVQELAILVAGARVAAAALARQSPAQAEETERVLAGFDRATSHLRPVPGPPTEQRDEAIGLVDGRIGPADIFGGAT